jgi:hypothetical protein
MNVCSVTILHHFKTLRSYIAALYLLKKMHTVFNSLKSKVKPYSFLNFFKYFCFQNYSFWPYLDPIESIRWQIDVDK